MASIPFDLITIRIINGDEREEKLEIPVTLNLSLMEALKAGGYPVSGTCGGIALCATCAIEVLSGMEQLSLPLEQELDMLDLLPNLQNHTRLACQIRLTSCMDGLTIRLLSPY